MESTPKEPAWIPLKTAAREFNVPRETLRTRIRIGAIRSKQIVNEDGSISRVLLAREDIAEALSRRAPHLPPVAVHTDEEWIPLKRAAELHGCDRQMIRSRIRAGLLEARALTHQSGTVTRVMVRAADVGPALAKSLRPDHPPAPEPPRIPEGWASVTRAAIILRTDPTSIQRRVDLGLVKANPNPTGAGTIVNLDDARRALAVSVRRERFNDVRASNLAKAEECIRLLDADECNLTEACKRTGLTISNVTNWTRNDWFSPELRDAGMRIRAATENYRNRRKAEAVAEMAELVRVARECSSMGELCAKAGVSRNRLKNLMKTSSRMGGMFDADLSAALHSTKKVAAFNRPAKETVGRVYVIGCKTSSGPIKVGFTAFDAKNRLHNIQNGNPEKLDILAMMMGSRWLERRLHAILAPYRQSGEWFKRAAPVRAMIDTMAALPLMDTLTDAHLEQLAAAVVADTVEGDCEAI